MKNNVIPIPKMVLTTLLLFGIVFVTTCKKDEKKCWSCGVNYNIVGLAPVLDTICDKTEEEKNLWMQEKAQVQGGNIHPTVWCDALNK